MASVQEIRQRLRGQRIETLRSRIEPLLAGRAGAEVWLFGSLARGDWDARLFERIRRLQARFDGLCECIEVGYAEVPEAEGLAEIDAAVAASRDGR